MQKIKNLKELRDLNKQDLIEEMLKGTIKGGASCANINPNLQQRPMLMWP